MPPGARLFNFHDFEPPYLNAAGRGCARRLYNGLSSGKDEEDKKAKYVEPKEKAAPRKGALRRKAGEKEKKKVIPSEKGRKSPEGEKMTKEAKDALKDKLAKLRERIGVGGKGDAANKDEEAFLGKVPRRPLLPKRKSPAMLWKDC